MAPPLSPLRKFCLISDEKENDEFSSSDDEETVDYSGGRRRRLSFHSIHGNCIKREQGRFRVVRTDDWYCEGIVFSNRPIAIDERVCVRLSEISTKKKFLYAFRFGVTNVDPVSLRDEEFSEYGHHLNKKPGYWIDWLHYRNISEGNLVEFFVSPSGDLHYSIKEKEKHGEYKGIFRRDISTDCPLWAIFDVSDTVKAIDFCEWSIDEEKWIPSIGCDDEERRWILCREFPHDVGEETQHYTRARRLRFHSIHGESIMREHGRYRVVRTDDSHCDGIVFSNRPIKIDERVCLQLTGVTARKKRRVLRLGVTNVDPMLLVNEELPMSAVQEPGFWTKWVPNRYISEGGLVQFHISKKGEIRYNINGENKGIFLRGINTDCPLWVMIDVYGSVKGVEFCEKTFDDEDWDAADYDDEVDEEDHSTLAPFVPGLPRRAVEFCEKPVDDEDWDPADFEDAVSVPASVQSPEECGEEGMDHNGCICCATEEHQDRWFAAYDRVAERNEEIN